MRPQGPFLVAALGRSPFLSAEGKLLGSKQVGIDAFLHGFPTTQARSGGDTLLLGLARGYSIPRQPESEGAGALVRLTLDGDVVDTVRGGLGPLRRHGRYLGSLPRSAALSVTRISGEAIYGIERNELGVRYVKRYRIERPQ